MKEPILKHQTLQYRINVVVTNSSLLRALPCPEYLLAEAVPNASQHHEFKHQECCVTRYGQYPNRCQLKPHIRRDLGNTHERWFNHVGNILSGMLSARLLLDFDEFFES